ncbi:MAG: amidohydrolase family protein [Gemmatimonadota bacterium]
MRHSRHCIQIFGLFLLIATAAPAAMAQSLAFTRVTVIDVRDGTVRPNTTVVVTGNRITAVGPVGAVEIPSGATVIDGTGRFLIPGLWDMHAHTTTDRNTREVIFPLLVAHGVTGIRSMAADCFETGEPNCEEEGSSATLATIEDVRRWRREMASGDLVGPRVVAGSYYVNSPPPGELSTSQYPRTAEHGRAHARLLHGRGVDFVKVYDMLSREAYFALADEADRLGLPFAGHTPIAVRASEASDAGQVSIEHLGMGNVLEECSSREDDLRQRLIAVFQKAEMGSRHTSDGPAILPLVLEMVETHDAEKCAALAERFVQNRTWVVPTLMIARLPSELGRGWREDPYARFLPPDERRYFEWAEETYARDPGDPPARAPYSRWVREVTGTMHRAGVRMLAGSDAGELASSGA